MAGSLVVMLAICLVSSWMTRGAMSELPQSRPNTLVDTHPWQTAEALAALAASAEENRFAREAQRLADHEVDQAFAAALREATLHHPVVTGESSDLTKKIKVLQDLVASDQARIKELTAHDPDNSLDIAKAQLELDTDQLTEAQQDLAQAGGDDRARIQQELAAREASLAKYDAKVASQGDTALTVSQNRESFAAAVKAWFAERTRRDLLLAAALQSRSVAAAYTIHHNTLKAKLAPAPESENRAERLAGLQSQTTYSQLVGIYDDRIASLNQLGSVYTAWANQVSLQHRMTTHEITQSLALIVLILLGVLGLDTLAARLAHRPSLDRRRMQTLSTILKAVVQCVGVLLILLIVFGTPRQMPTILGLATAGLTVVLQDFIIAFFGWFVLMGKNGIRIGDWVEINGVAGEVVSIGLFRTTLLETGSTIQRGRPTGRTITLINSYAIKGQFFNFSTKGQWMWDELRVAVPNDRDAYSIVEQVRKEVVEETARDVHAADEEWTRLDRQFSAEPTVNMRPGAAGIELVVRYVTRASERFDVRNRFYLRILNLLLKPAVKGAFTS